MYKYIYNELKKKKKGDYRPVNENRTFARRIHQHDNMDGAKEIDEDRRSFLESVIAASTPVHWPFTPAQVTLTTDAPPLDDDVICKLCGLCVR